MRTSFGGLSDAGPDAHLQGHDAHNDDDDDYHEHHYHYGGHRQAKPNPFVEYEDREKRLKDERRWLLHDSCYLEEKVLTLKQASVHKNLWLDTIPDDDLAEARILFGNLSKKIRSIRNRRSEWAVMQRTTSGQSDGSHGVDERRVAVSGQAHNVRLIPFGRNVKLDVQAKEVKSFANKLKDSGRSLEKAAGIGEDTPRKRDQPRHPQLEGLGFSLQAFFGHTAEVHYT